MNWTDETYRRQTVGVEWPTRSRDESPSLDDAGSEAAGSGLAADPAGVARQRHRDRRADTGDREDADGAGARRLRYWLFVDGRPVACVVEVDEL